MNTNLIDSHVISNSPVLLIFAAVVSLVCFFCSRPVFEEHFKIGPPDLIAGVVAGLAFLGLVTRGQGRLGSLLLLYSTLAICMTLAVILDGAVRIHKRWKERKRLARLERCQPIELPILPFAESDLYRLPKRRGRRKSVTKDQPFERPPFLPEASDEPEASARPEPRQARRRRKEQQDDQWQGHREPF